jgi:Lar family restriction alleviation protein
MTNTTLKPCPFCGGEAFLYVETLPTIGHEWATVKCWKCQSRIERPHRNEAIAAWNTRAERTCTRDKEGFCSSCGLFHVDGIAYCPYCGARVIAQ